jgi:hypothetical protein
LTKFKNFEKKMSRFGVSEEAEQLFNFAKKLSIKTLQLSRGG